MTLREHIASTFERHWESTNSWGTWCCRCLLPWPCSDYEHAVAALAILDAAGGYHAADDTDYRLVPDPESSA